MNTSNCVLKYKTIVLLFATIQLTSGFLADLPQIIDLSNVDLNNYQFFKNFASQNPRTAAQANPIIEHFQRKKAVLDYIEHLFLGNSPFTQESEIPFNPHFGRAWRPHFERKFGKRGQKLIEILGKGRNWQAAPKYEKLGIIYYPAR